MPIPNPVEKTSAPISPRGNALTRRRDFVPRPELCRKNRKGKVVGYGKVPGWDLTIREIEDFLLLPHE